MEMEQSQMEENIKERIERFIEELATDAEIFSALAALLCRYFGVYKTTIVNVEAGKSMAYTYFNTFSSDAGIKTLVSSFPHFAHVEALLRGKNLVYLNKYTISLADISFFDSLTISACILPLRKGNLKGYVIFENDDDSKSFTAGTEDLMKYAAAILSDWLSQKDHEHAYKTERTSL
jgi:hypothetical protein